jgi:S-adenosylmethionine/arginine decarboxylase-like enzyme
VDEGFAAFDIFTCGPMNTDKVLEVIRDGIKPHHASVRRIVRGGDSGPGLTNTPAATDARSGSDEHA